MIRRQEFAILSKEIGNQADAEIFISEVSDMLDRRWQLHGAMSAIDRPSRSRLQFTQAFIRETFG